MGHRARCDRPRGHWFHGRIYNRRSDLSPDGTKLIYFASKFTARTVNDRECTYAWTAISKPPWLTALALWPKGDCWWGGGLLKNDRTVLLNHRPDEARPHADHQPPRSLKVHANRKAHGEDDPLYSERLTRDGWELIDEWKVDYLGRPEMFKTLQPERRRRRHPHSELAIELTRRLDGLKYRERFAVIGAQPPLSDLEHADRVDWDQRVVLPRGRLSVAAVEDARVGELRELVDLTSDRPEPRVAPDWARRW